MDFTSGISTLAESGVLLKPQAYSPKVQTSARWSVTYVDVCIIKGTLRRLTSPSRGTAKCLFACSEDTAQGVYRKSATVICDPNLPIDSANLSRASPSLTQTRRHTTTHRWMKLHMKQSKRKDVVKRNFDVTIRLHPKYHWSAFHFQHYLSVNIVVGYVFSLWHN